MHIQLRDELRGGHIRTQVFIGADKDHLKLSGELIFRGVGDWNLFCSILHYAESAMPSFVKLAVSCPDESRIIAQFKARKEREREREREESCKMRRIRILVYDGSREWVEQCLNSPDRYVKDTVWPESHRYITEAILPPESCDEAGLNTRALAIFDEVRGLRKTPQEGGYIPPIPDAAAAEAETRDYEDWLARRDYEEGAYA